MTTVRILYITAVVMIVGAVGGGYLLFYSSNPIFQFIGLGVLFHAVWILPVVGFALFRRQTGQFTDN